MPRIWGSTDLRAWYPERSLEVEPIGEAWLSPPECPVLVKMLFPLQRLSVQVHPDDAYAARHAMGRGKTEAWYVLEADPEARLGVGLRPDARWDDFGDHCRAGRGSALLDWLPVETGDVIHVPAGTVHAIGPGVVLLEVQQASDNTFRLDDYGRGRALHLEHGLAVARPTAAGKVRPRLAADQSGLLLQTPYFRMHRHCLAGGWELPPSARPRWLVNVSPGSGGDAPIPPRGHLLELPAGMPLASSDAAKAWTLIEIEAGEAGFEPCNGAGANGLPRPARA